MSQHCRIVAEFLTGTVGGEFDLDDEDSDSKAPLQDSVIESSQEQGATMSDFMT